ncbi:MAG: type II toxin-antitoxin system PemK/MazF family toxin [Chloroflexota bacterium]|nr:type II toxin-antitoxin system PemK/MazF family toxin [Chloroflexota bacterium]
MSFPQRGEVYWVKLDPTIGSEIAKTRPAVIISNNVGNQHADRVIVAPISAGGVLKLYPYEVKIEDVEGGLGQTSKVLLDQIRTVDKTRLGNRIGALTSKQMEAINRAIGLSLAV